jgi:hypothetical protein
MSAKKTVPFILELLDQKKDPEQPGSRELEPLGPTVPGSRVWKTDRFEILYHLGSATSEVTVAQIKLGGVDLVVLGATPPAG